MSPSRRTYHQRERQLQRRDEKIFISWGVRMRIIRVAAVTVSICIVFMLWTQVHLQCYCQTILEERTPVTGTRWQPMQNYNLSYLDSMKKESYDARASTENPRNNIDMAETATATTPQAGLFVEQPIIYEPFDCSSLVPCSSLEINTTLTMSRQCHAFFPLRFWSSPLAAEFRPALHYQRIKRPQACYEQEMVILTRRYDLVHPIDGDPLPQPPEECANDLPDSLTYFHNFKTGGTTAFHTMVHQRVPFYNVTNDHKIFTQYLLNDYEEDAPIMQRKAFEAILDLEKRQNDPTSNDIIFTFTRSPVRRFLSGVSQIESMNLIYEVPIANRHCYDQKNDRIERIRCIVDDIQQNGVFYNIHLYPQMYLFDSWTNWGLSDLKIVVMDMEDMDQIFHSLTGSVKRERQSEGRKQISVHDLPPSLIQQICTLFQVDLIVLQMLGLDDGLCPTFFPVSSKQEQHYQPQQELSLVSTEKIS
jgi:hypothetical protein